MKKTLSTIFIALAFTPLQVAGQSTDKVTLDDARVIAETSSYDPKRVRYTLRPRWSNANPNRTKIKYTIRFFDSRRAEVYREENTVEIDPFGGNAKSVYITSVNGKASDNFESKDLALITIKYSTDKDTSEKHYPNVLIVASRD
jgi:hypothetical protein